jgi:hypothetical protein
MEIVQQPVAQPLADCALFKPRRVALDDGVGIDDELSRASDQRDLVGLAARDQASVEATRYPPDSGPASRRAEQLSAFRRRNYPRRRR